MCCWDPTASQDGAVPHQAASSTLDFSGSSSDVWNFERAKWGRGGLATLPRVFQTWGDCCSSPALSPGHPRDKEPTQGDFLCPGGHGPWCRDWVPAPTDLASPDTTLPRRGMDGQSARLWLHCLNQDREENTTHVGSVLEKDWEHRCPAPEPPLLEGSRGRSSSHGTADQRSRLRGGRPGTGGRLHSALCLRRVREKRQEVGCGPRHGVS